MVQMLGKGPKAVGELAGAFALSAPAISKHLRVLRHCLLVEEERHARDARLRIYRLRREPLDDLDAWLAHMRAFWEVQLGAFAEHVAQRTAQTPSTRRLPVQGKRQKRSRQQTKISAVDRPTSSSGRSKVRARAKRERT